MEAFSLDKKTIKKNRFEYHEEGWKCDGQMKLIKVRATNYKSNTIEVGILTDDKKRDSKEIITLMFKRWVQENDFKYLGDHFGINEITSYSTIPYKQLESYLTDKEIDELDRVLIEITNQMKVTDKVMSKLDYLIEQNYFKLNKNCKSIMDALKILARNAYYKEIQVFNKLYHNYRDDHVVFRNLIQSSGIIEKKESMTNIYMMPTMNCSPNLKQIITKIFGIRNESTQIMPDGSDTNFNIFLAEKEGIDIAISNR